MAMRDHHIIQALCNTYWAMEETKLREIVGVIERRSRWEGPADEFVKAERLPIDRYVDCATGADLAISGGGSAPNAGKIAILQLFGVLSQRMGMIEEASGGTSTEEFGRVFNAAVANPDIRGIILQISSPGGSVAGTAELADSIYQARTQKRIIAIADSLAASAAYWIGAQASEFWATPTAEVGSVGVFSVHQDVSKAAEQAGVKFTIVKAGKYKTEGSPYEPLSDEARVEMQAGVDYFNGMFIRALAAGPGVRVDKRRSDFGHGRGVRMD